MCHVKSNKKCDFDDLFEFFSTFWNLIHFWPRSFSLNFRKLLIRTIFIFCLVNRSYVSHGIDQKVWFWRSFWIFLNFGNFIHFQPRNFSLNFRKLLIWTIFIFCPVNRSYTCHMESTKKCDFVDLFQFFLTFWSFIHF